MEGKNTHLRMDLIEKVLEPYRKYGFNIESIVPTDELKNRLITEYFVKNCDEMFYDAYIGNNSIDPKVRLTTCNWVENHSKGNFGATQEDVDSIACFLFDQAIEFNNNNSNRFYIISKRDMPILVYWYGRDLFYKDIMWEFVQRKI